MIQGNRTSGNIALPRACVITLLIALLIFPPSMFGDPIGWNGGNGAYTDNNWTCNNCDPSDTPLYPNNGQFGAFTYDVSIHSGGGVSAGVSLDNNNIEQGIDAVTVDSMSIRGGHVSSTASLTVGNGTLSDGLPNLTIGTPQRVQGNALSIGNRGSLNVGDASGVATVAVDLSGGGGSIYPGAPNSVGAYVANGGAVNVIGAGPGAGGSTLQFLNSSGGIRGIVNNGSINVGADGSDSTLQFSNQSGPFIGSAVPGNFILTGNGAVNLAGNSAITGTTGTESLINDYGHTISASGVNGIYGLGGGFTNNGTLAVTGSGPDGVSSSSLEVASPLTNYNTVTSQLTNGTYNVQNGGTLRLDSIGMGNSIGSLNLVNMQLSGPGATILGGPDQAQHAQNSGTHSGSISPTYSSVIGGLTHLTDSSLDLQGVSTSITPSNWSGTLTLRSDPLGIPTTLTVEQDPGQNASNVTIAGNVKNVSSVTGAPQQSDINGNSGSTINVNGSSLNITGNLSNRAYTNPMSGLATYGANSTINVTNGGSLTVGTVATPGNPVNTLSTYTNNGFASSNINVTGSSLTVNGNLRQGGVGNLSQGSDTLKVNGSTLTVNGNFTNNNGGSQSTVNVSNGSTATVTGWYGQFQAGNGSGQSSLNITGSQMTVGNLRNSTDASGAGSIGFAPQSQIYIANGSLTVNNTFANVDGNGVLTGGSYYMGGGGVLNYTGANITAIGTNTALVLDDNVGPTGQILNGGSDAVAGSLNEVTGRLGLTSGTVLNLTSANGLTIDAGGQVSLGFHGTTGNATLSATSLTNSGELDANYSGNAVNVTSLNNLSGGVLSGGTWNLNGKVNFSNGADSSTAITGLSGANVSLGSTGGFFNGSTDALNGLNSVGGGSTLTINGQTRSFGPVNVDASTLNLANSADITFNGPAAPSTGDGLSLTSNATMNVGQSTATLNLANGNTASITGANLNVNDGGTLNLTGGTSAVPGVVNVNNNLNTSVNGILALQTLSSGPSGTLSVSDGGTYQINGDGYVRAFGGAIDVSNGNLTINANLTNLSGETLTGGSYNIGANSVLQLSGIGGGGSLTNIVGANVSITGNGVLTGGISQSLPQIGGGSQVITNFSPPPSALTNLAELNGATLSLINAGNVGITPNTGTFLVDNFVDAGTTGTLNLRQGTNLTVNGNFESDGGNVNITNHSSLTVGNNFNNVDGNGNLGGVPESGTGHPINLLVGSGSSLSYNGANITSVASQSTLTLGNLDGKGTGTILNNGNDALSGSLSTVYGTMNLQNGANLTLTGTQPSFQNWGTVTITNGSTFDVSALHSNFLDVTGGGSLNGNYLIGSNSVLNYSGASTNITNINGSLTLDNANSTQAVPTVTGMITNGKGNDALSASLTSVGGTLTLQNNANLTLTGAQSGFALQSGTVNIMNGSTFDVSKVGANFSDIDGSGNMGGAGNYLIGTNSVLKYSGADITTISGNLTLDNTNNGTTGTISNISGSNDALSGTLTTISGALNLQNNAQVELSSASGVTVNGGSLNLDQNQGQGNSTLTVDNKLTNYNGFIAVGSQGSAGASYLYANGGLSNKTDDNNSDSFGLSQISAQHSYTQVTGNFFNGAFATAPDNGNGGQAIVSVGLDSNSGLTVTGNLKNLALGGSVLNDENGNEISSTTSTATINLTNESSLQVNGNVQNIAVKGTIDGSGNNTTNASINLDGLSGLTVGGAFTNYSGGAGSGGFASLNLTNGSTATVSGLFTNSGFSEVTLDGDDGGDLIGNGGSTLSVAGGFKNYNGGVFLNNASTLNVQNGFQNLGDDSANSGGNGGSILVIEGGPGPSQGGGEQLGSLQLQTNHEDCGCDVGGASVATITGGLINSATTSNNGYAQSQVIVAPGGTLNVDNLTNVATNATPGGSDTALAQVELFGGNLNITGNLTNGYSTPSFQNTGLPAQGSVGYSEASVLSYGGAISVGGSLNNTNGEVGIYESSLLNASNSVLNSATDTNFDPTAPTQAQLSGYSDLTLDESSGFVKGGLTNSAISTLGGYAQATLNIADGSQMIVSAPTSSPTQATVYALTNLAKVSLTGGPGIASAVATISNGGGLTVYGNLLNMSVVSGGKTQQPFGPHPGGAVINVVGDGNGDTLGGSTLLVTGVFNNTAATLNVSGGSTATVTGLFTNDANSIVNLNESDPFIGGGVQGTLTGHASFQGQLPPTQLITNGGFSNAGAVNLNDNTALVNTGTFLNTGCVSIGNGSFLVTNEDSNGLSAYNQTGGTTMIVAGGTLQADSVNITGGKVQGSGGDPGQAQPVATIYGALTIGGDPTDPNQTQNATLILSPQDNPADPMALDVIGSYDQTALGILDLTLAQDGGLGSFQGSDDSNNDYDQVDVTGDVIALDGLLNVTLDLQDGVFDAQQNDYFDILNWTGANDEWQNEQFCPANGGEGCFGTVNIDGMALADATFTDINGQLDTFVEEINTGDQGTELDLVVTGVSATPEPGTLSMLFCAMLIGGGVTWYRRRRKNVAQ